MNLIVATKNIGKVKELKLLLNDKFSNILSLRDIDRNFEIVEDELTFSGNAMKKAITSYEHLKGIYKGYFFLGEDSGLEVKALGGGPGVFSARYAREKATDEENIKKLLEEMKDIPFNERDANYTCSMVLVFPDGKYITSTGKCYGKIGFEPRGKNGFGYDPVFLTEESNFKLTMAEISEEEKNKISHRRKALENLLNELGNIR